MQKWPWDQKKASQTDRRWRICWCVADKLSHLLQKALQRYYLRKIKYNNIHFDDSPLRVLDSPMCPWLISKTWEMTTCVCDKENPDPFVLSLSRGYHNLSQEKNQVRWPDFKQWVIIIMQKKKKNPVSVPGVTSSSRVKLWSYVEEKAKKKPSLHLTLLKTRPQIRNKPKLKPSWIMCGRSSHAPLLLRGVADSLGGSGGGSVYAIHIHR